MNDKILLSEEISEIVYEPHIKRADKLPFIFHIDDIRCRAMANLHENIELLYILEGTGQVLLGDKAQRRAPAGSSPSIPSWHTAFFQKRGFATPA